MLRTTILSLALLGPLTASALAEKSSEFFKRYGEYNDLGRALLDKIEPRTGAVDLPDGVHINLAGKFYFLDHEDAATILVEAWGNPPASASESLGMIFPIDRDPLDDAWGIELRMDKIGYVDDREAASIDYGELLERMKSDTLASNDERQKAGYPAVELIGWASPPKYDAVNKRLHWAKELQFAGATARTLNYDVRFLGREGVFIMSYIAGIDQLEEIKAGLDDVLKLPSFTVGRRYSDYVPGADTVAAVGLGGLIAGKAVIKTGLLAAALVALKKFGFLLLVPLLGLWRFIRSGRTGADS